jgi:hypothetical protein
MNAEKMERTGCGRGLRSGIIRGSNGAPGGNQWWCGGSNVVGIETSRHES